jgi:hypothetical protein
VFEALQDQIDKQLGNVATKIEAIANELGLPEVTESAPLVANISVRECRLWVQLNTTDFRQRLQSARGTTELDPIMQEISSMILGDVATVPADIVFKVYKTSKGLNVVSPLVYYICTGMDIEGNKLHNLVHIGCTRERFPMWKPLQQHRDNARDDLIGQQAINGWREWRDQLARLGPDRAESTYTLRENLMRGNIEQLPQWAHQLVTNKLRACGHHVGQSFQQTDWNEVKLMGCCLSCKTTVAFEEVQEKDFKREASGINILQRKECPHSCAEVVTSGICDFVTRTQ